jgi:pimeloyl-ACP methyl ester carboxylesterase
LLVGIDGTSSKKWRETDPETQRATNSNVFNMAKDFEGPHLYLDGPNTLGTDVRIISARALAFIHAQLRENPNLAINLVGHSRGGLIAIDLANQLKDGFADVNGGVPIRINFLGLFDAVDRAVGMDGTRIRNVDSVFHIIRNPEGGSRRLFGNTGLQAEADVTNRKMMLTGTHSAIGGDPGKGDFARTNIPLAQEMIVGKQADWWMRTHAGMAGLSFK